MATMPLDEADEDDEAGFLFFLMTELNRKLGLGLDCQVASPRDNNVGVAGKLYILGNSMHKSCHCQPKLLIRRWS